MWAWPFPIMRYRLLNPFFQSFPTTTKPFRSAWQTVVVVVVGGQAATAAFVIVKAIG